MMAGMGRSNHPAGRITSACTRAWASCIKAGVEPALIADLSSLRVALDQELAEFDSPLAGIREVAIFPPMTGG